MFRKLKTAYRKFARDDPGSRFLHLHQHSSREIKGPAGRVAVIIIGVVLIVVGILLGFIPGVPGIVLGVIGLALIAAQFRPAAMGCDRFEVWLRRVSKKWRRRPATHR